MRLPSGITVPDERRDQLRGLASVLNLHIAGVVLLALICAYLGVQLYLTSGKTGVQGDEAIVIGQSRVAAAEIAAKPLRGVDSKLAASEDEAAKFYKDRLPFAYSDVATQLGAISKKTNVRLSRASYVQTLPSDGVTELRIDASVTGDYVSLAHFVNELERSKSFFLIENVSLSGAQNGLVNLQMRIGTWIREPMPGFAEAQTTAGARP
jgi:type IV pilus assembly protein PilO